MGFPSSFQLSGIASLEMPGAPTSDPPKCERISEKLYVACGSNLARINYDKFGTFIGNKNQTTTFLAVA